MMKQFIKGLFVGGTIGGVGGLLFAPRKGSDTLKIWEEPIKETAKTIQTVKEDYETVNDKLAKTQEIAKTTLPTFQKSLEEDLRAFQFQAKPRINRINEQLPLLQQHLENSPLNKPTK